MTALFASQPLPFYIDVIKALTVKTSRLIRSQHIVLTCRLTLKVLAAPLLY